MGSEASHTVLLRRGLDADAAVVWRAVTEPSGLAAWLGRHEGPPLGQGARFALWHDGVVRSEHEILEWAPCRLLAVTWDFPGEQPSRVQVLIEPADVGSTLVLQHEDVQDLSSYTAGWRVHLDFLARYLEGRPRSFHHFWRDYEALLDPAASASDEH